MRNVMLGDTGVGKTTYVTSAYLRFQEPIKGFTLRAQSDSDHRDFLRLGREASRGKYPEGTDAWKAFQFNLRHDGQTVLEFAWADYRGAALTESASTQQTRQILDDLKEADAIQVFVDASEIVSGKRVRSRLGRMTTLIAEAISGSHKQIPLAILLTKYDTVPLSRRGEALHEPLQGLMAAIRHCDHITGSIFPVSAGASPMDITMPILFVLRRGLTAECDRRRLQHRLANEELSRVQDQCAAWDLEERHHNYQINHHPFQTFFKYVFTETDHYASAEKAKLQLQQSLFRASAARDEADGKKQHLERIMPSVRALDSLLANIVTI